MPTSRRLTADQEAQFLRDGFVALPGALDRAFCRHHCEKVMAHLGLSMTDAATWTDARLHLPSLDKFTWQTEAPPVWEAICDLLGGAERVAPDTCFGNGMIINFRQDADRPWLPPGPDVKGWHKDGNWFHHFLDSPEQALLVIVVWKDIPERGGGTYFAPDSVGHVARYLAAHPEGVTPNGFPIGELIAQCRDFRELRAQAGDVYLLHGFMLHSASANHAGTPRFITNPNVALREPLCLDRPDGAYSLLERATLGHLGVPRLAFQPTTPRRRYQGDHLKAYEQFKQRQAAKP
jgi:hypothetical protein